MERTDPQSPALPVIILIIMSFMMIFSFVGCEKKEEATEIKEIRLGATFPLTGDVASYGQKAKRGIEIAVSEINANGGILGRQVKVDFQDDKNDPKEAVSIMSKFATVDKLSVVFGSAGSTVSLAIAPLANQYKVIQISPISSSSKLSSEGGEYFFRTCPADDLQSDVLTNWVYESGARKVAVVYTNNSWGKPLAEDFEKKFTALGGIVAISEGVFENEKDLRTIISKIKKIEEIDAVVSPTYPKEGGMFVRQAKELGLKIKMFGGDNWGSPEFLNVAGDAAEGVFYTAPSDSQSPGYAKFAQKYEEQYGEAPDVFGGYAYDAAYAIFKAIEMADSDVSDSIRAALHKISFEGVSGQISFKDNGDINSMAFGRKSIKNGQVTTLN